MDKFERFRRTRKGVSLAIFRSQKLHSSRRGFGFPMYTLEEFREWIYSQSNFKYLFDAWVASNYEKKSKPSVDRINDNLGYTFENMRLTSFDKNIRKSRGNISIITPIKQYDLNGAYIKTFRSQQDAVRKIGMSQGNLWVSLNKDFMQHKCYGFYWRYA